MAKRNHRRHSRRKLGWEQRQAQHARASAEEHGNTLLDRALGRAWSTEHAELLLEALDRSTATEHWYVWRRPGEAWRLGRYVTEARV